MSVALPPNSDALGPVADEPSPSDRPGRSALAVDWLLWIYRRWWWFFLGTLVGFYLAAFNGRWQPEPDSALHLSIGRNLARGEGYTHAGMPHALAYPGMPYLIAATFKLFGIGAEWAPHVVVLAMALAAVALLYRLFRLHTGSTPKSIFLTCMVGMSFTLFRYAFELRNDVPFFLGTVAFLVGVESWRKALTGDEGPSPVRRTAPWYDTVLLVGGLALAAVMRPHVWVLLLAIVAAGAMELFRMPRRWKIVAGIAIVLATVAIVLVLLSRRDGGTYEAALVNQVARLSTADMLRSVAVDAWEVLDGTLAESTLGHKLGPGLTAVYGVAILALGVGLIRRRPLWGLFVLGSVVMLLHPAVVPVPRYLLPILPLMALAWFDGIAWLNRRLPPRWGNTVFAVLLVLWVVPNFLKITKLVAEQRSTTFADKYGDGAEHASLRALADRIAAAVEPDALVLAHRKIARVLAYWADRHVVAADEMPLTNGDAPLYVVRPMGEQAVARLQAQRLAIGGEVARQPAGGRKASEDWVVYRLIDATEAAADVQSADSPSAGLPSAGLPSADLPAAGSSAGQRRSAR